MRFTHSMPFGAEPMETGRTRFGLWAPAGGDAWLRLEGPSRREEIRMQAEPEMFDRHLPKREALGERIRADLSEHLPRPP